MAKKEEEQINLPNIPTAPKPYTTFYRVNFQYQGPNYALRMGSLMIPGNNLEEVRIIANGTLKNQYGDKWFNITKITNETPF